MKHVFLVRHAKSSWAESGIGDHERSLTDRGISDTAKVFLRLRDSVTTPESIISSDAVRARSTATRLVQTLGLNASALQLEPALYHASAEDILEVIRNCEDTVHSAAFVGHNPGLTDAANLLVDALMLDNLPTCGVVGVHFSVKKWRDLAFGEGDLTYFDYPKNPSAPLTRLPRGFARDRE
jgi:phosphohistidine phosphatase